MLGVGLNVFIFGPSLMLAGFLLISKLSSTLRVVCLWSFYSSLCMEYGYGDEIELGFKVGKFAPLGFIAKGALFWRSKIFQ